MVESCHMTVWKRMSASAFQSPKADGQLSARSGRGSSAPIMAVPRQCGGSRKRTYD
jgi:hypothetical protein